MKKEGDVPRVGIRQVAAHANVALGTVSHYLNHPDRVSAEKAARIQQAIEVLGFVPNNVGRQLRLGQSTSIAYVVPDVSNPFFATIAEGVEQRATAEGLSVFIANTNRDREREDTYLELLEQQQVRGMLVASPRPIEDRLLRMQKRGTPSVLVGQAATSSQQTSVSIDDALGGRLAADHLLSLGRRRVAFVGGPLGIKQVADRLQGASDVVGRAGTATLEVLGVNDRTVSAGREVAAAVLRRAPETRPDAIFAVNDLLALGILQGLFSAGVRVPDEIALVGFDDIEYAETSLIPLTSVRPPHEQFGVTAVELLLAELNGTAVPESRRRVFAPDLVVRASTVG